MTTYTSKNGTISITDDVSSGYSSESKIPCNAKDRNGEFKNVLLDCLNMTKRIVELEKVLLATPNTHSDEWSDYVCTFCSASDSSHEDDCVYLLAINLRNKALKEPKQ
jgi:hypothetical protein